MLLPLRYGLWVCRIHEDKKKKQTETALTTASEKTNETERIKRKDTKRNSLTGKNSTLSEKYFTHVRILCLIPSSPSLCIFFLPKRRGRGGGVKHLRIMNIHGLRNGNLLTLTRRTRGGKYRRFLSPAGVSSPT